MPHTYGPQFDLGPEGYHAQCALCGYEYGTHMAEGERCPTKFKQPAKDAPSWEEETVDYHAEQRFVLRPASSSNYSEPK